LKDLLPAVVYDAIEQHLHDGGVRAREGWEAGEDEEDTLTGHVGAIFQTDWSYLRANGDAWSWRVRYKKFRGRGPGAFEKRSGADGIFQVEVNNSLTIRFKGLLFQAKKGRDLNGNLVEQVASMERIATNGSAVFEYGPDEYRGISGKDYLEAQQTRASRSAVRDKLQPLGTFLGREFLGCAVGLRDLYYEATRGHLWRPDGSAIPFAVRHRLLLQVERLR